MQNTLPIMIQLIFQPNQRIIETLEEQRFQATIKTFVHRLFRPSLA